MRGSLKLTLGIGLLSLVALGIPACGDDDEGGGGKAGSGGTGGTEAGSGGTAGSGGSGGSAGGVTCGGTACKTWKVGGIFDVGACCSANDKCGADISATVGGVIGLPAGCYETNQPGNVDCTSCDPFIFDNPLDTTSDKDGKFYGCCRSDNTCGIWVDLETPVKEDDGGMTDYKGPKLGCIDGKGLSGFTSKSCTPGTPPADNKCPEPGDAGTD